MVNKDRIIIGFMVLIIIFSIGSIVIISNLDFDDAQATIVKEADSQSTNIGLAIQLTPQNSEVNG